MMQKNRIFDNTFETRHRAFHTALSNPTLFIDLDTLKPMMNGPPANYFFSVNQFMHERMFSRCASTH